VSHSFASPQAGFLREWSLATLLGGALGGAAAGLVASLHWLPNAAVVPAAALVAASFVARAQYRVLARRPATAAMARAWAICTLCGGAIWMSWSAVAAIHGALYLHPFPSAAYPVRMSDLVGGLGWFLIGLATMATMQWCVLRSWRRAALWIPLHLLLAAPVALATAAAFAAMSALAVLAAGALFAAPAGDGLAKAAGLAVVLVPAMAAAATAGWLAVALATGCLLRQTAFAATSSVPPTGVASVGTGRAGGSLVAIAVGWSVAGALGSAAGAGLALALAPSNDLLLGTMALAAGGLALWSVTTAAVGRHGWRAEPVFQLATILVAGQSGLAAMLGARPDPEHQFLGLGARELHIFATALLGLGLVAVERWIVRREAYAWGLAAIGAGLAPAAAWAIDLARRATGPLADALADVGPARSGGSAALARLLDASAGTLVIALACGLLAWAAWHRRLPRTFPTARAAVRDRTMT
jgi:hypothetical protein